MSWSDKTVELVKNLWKEGKSAGDISKIIKTHSRNAVLGKLHRLGLARGNRAPTKPKSIRTVNAFNGIVEPLEVVGAYVDEAALLPSNYIEILQQREVSTKEAKTEDPDSPRTRPLFYDLRPDQCKWIDGDPLLNSGRLCQNKRLPGNEQYCKTHKKASLPKPKENSND